MLPEGIEEGRLAELFAIFYDDEKTPESIVASLRSSLLNLRSLSWTVKTSEPALICEHYRESVNDDWCLTKSPLSESFASPGSSPQHRPLLEPATLDRQHAVFGLRVWVDYFTLETFVNEVTTAANNENAVRGAESRWTVDTLVSGLHSHIAADGMVYSLPDLDLLDVFLCVPKKGWDLFPRCRAWLEKLDGGVLRVPDAAKLDKLLRLAFADRKTRLWRRVCPQGPTPPSTKQTHVCEQKTLQYVVHESRDYEPF